MTSSGSDFASLCPAVAATETVSGISRSMINVLVWKEVCRHASNKTAKPDRWRSKCINKVSNFNTCTHQPLPKMSGTLLRCWLNFDDTQALPVCHKIVTMPIHWREKVKADIDRDNPLGVLQKLPDNTPRKGLFCMVITSKANCDPRWPIDYEPLNKKAPIQTYPLVNPFHLASRIPSHTKPLWRTVNEGGPLVRAWDAFFTVFWLKIHYTVGCKIKSKKYVAKWC